MVNLLTHSYLESTRPNLLLIDEAKRKWKALDLYYIPTRYPNGLPAGIPTEAF